MKQKKQLAVLIVLMVIAAGVWLWDLRSNKSATPDDPITDVKNDPVLQVENPRIRLDEIEKARKAQYNSSGRNIFSLTSAPISQAPGQHRPIVKDPAPKIWPTPCGLYGPCKEVPPPPPPPLVLPANVKCFGYGVVPNGTARRAFLTDGEDVLVVSEGETFLNRFRMLKIGNSNIQFEELSTGRTATAACEEQSAPGGGPQ